MRYKTNFAEVNMKESIVETLLRIGNDPEVIKSCEPQVCFPFKLEEWMVVRVLKAQEILKSRRNK